MFSNLCDVFFCGFDGFGEIDTEVDLRIDQLGERIDFGATVEDIYGGRSAQQCLLGEALGREGFGEFGIRMRTFFRQQFGIGFREGRTVFACTLKRLQVRRSRSELFRVSVGSSNIEASDLGDSLGSRMGCLRDQKRCGT